MSSSRAMLLVQLANKELVYIFLVYISREFDTLIIFNFFLFMRFNFKLKNGFFILNFYPTPRRKISLKKAKLVVMKANSIVA